MENKQIDDININISKYILTKEDRAILDKIELYEGYNIFTLEEISRKLNLREIYMKDKLIHYVKYGYITRVNKYGFFKFFLSNKRWEE